MTISEVDQLFLKFGDPGRYQIATYCMLILSICATAFNNFIGLFVVSDYPHHCKIPAEWGWSVNESIPLRDDGELESCQMYKNPNNRSEGTTSCLFGWQHITPGSQWTIVQEWDLVCSSRHLGAVSISVYYGGVMSGCMVFGFLADKIGRKPVILGCLYVHIFLAVAISYSTSFLMYIILRMIHGAILQGIVGAAVVMSVEIFQPNRRNFVAIGNQVLWPSMLFVVTTFSYAVGSWRTLHLIGGVPAVVTIAYIWLFPESVRWCLVYQKLPQAYNYLCKTARFNNMPVPVDLEEDIKRVADNILATQKSSSKNASIKELFKTSKIRQVILSACCAWPITSLIYWGVSYSMPKFGSSNHVNFLISTSIEVFLSLVGMYWILQRFGRRNVCMTIMSFSAVLNVLAAILRNTLPQHETWAMIILGLTSICGRISLCLFYSCMPMFFRELYPTNVRNMANGVVQVSGRPATIMAPYMRLLEQDVWKALPYIIYAILSLVNVILVYLLPETLNKPLPEIPEDLDKLWENKAPLPRWLYRPVKDRDQSQETNPKENNLESQKSNGAISDVDAG